ncbi:MAG TPA: helix-turn-helix domain-containing protein [Miltoncostaeaceae bacterium]|nr:helix-turn-helix domain-containing protein [Miltoncostaeaceae bacterium]
MSGEISAGARRPYRKRRRAELEDETRRRITEATVALHGTLGPARTTVSAIAERAGVQRATVYRHFPDEQALIDACSTHWRAENPVPDIARWAAIEDPDARLRSALGELYAWYDRTEYMLEKTSRDAAVVEALRPAVARVAGWLDAAAGVLAEGRPGDAARGRAAIAHALAFDTWRSLVRRQGLPPEEAVELMARLAACA